MKRCFDRIAIGGLLFWSAFALAPAGHKGRPGDDACTARVESAVKYAIEAQTRTGRPLHLLVVRPFFNRGEMPGMEPGALYTVSRTYDTGYYSPGPFPVPFVSTGPFGIFSLWLDRVLTHLEKVYEIEREFEDEMLKWLRADFARERASPSPRSLLYFLLHPDMSELDWFTAYLRLFDASPENGDSPFMPLEHETDWRAPEREQGLNDGLVELGRGFRNPASAVQALVAFPMALKEIGTYLDIRFVSRNRPAKVRVLGDKDTRVVYRRYYGFKEEAGPDELKKPGVWVLQMTAAEFVRRFGTRWPDWKAAWQCELPIDPLSAPEAYRRAISLRAVRHMRMYREHNERLDALEQAQREGRVVIHGSFPRYRSYEEFVDSLFTQEPELLF